MINKDGLDFLRSLLRTIKVYKNEPPERVIGRIQERIESKL